MSLMLLEYMSYCYKIHPDVNIYVLRTIKNIDIEILRLFIELDTKAKKATRIYIQKIKRNQVMFGSSVNNGFKCLDGSTLYF